MQTLSCAFCKSPLSRTFVDLGMAPMVSSYLESDDLHNQESFFPLHAYVCDACFLVQLPEAQSAEDIFSEYPYFSSVSQSWLEHAQRFAATAAHRFNLGHTSQVVEVASNDGYLLRYFQEREIPVQGIEPAQNIAEAANQKGIPTISRFFGSDTAKRLVDGGLRADLLIGNNVLAHVPDIGDFVAGLKLMLKPGGAISLEFPHLLRTMMENQFDQVFHEHFSYLSLLAVERILESHDLKVFDIAELGTHGGSLRVFSAHRDNSIHTVSDSVLKMRSREAEYGLEKPETYDAFSQQVRETKYSVLKLLIEIKQKGQSIVGYGAPGKGCVMLNYCGIREEFLDYLVDLAPTKQNRYMPGVHLPILHPDQIKVTRPDYVFILPWNLRDEITQQLAYIREWGGKFVVPIPEATILQ